MFSNPIRPILDDSVFSILAELNLLNKKLLRDLEIRRKYFQLRQEGHTTGEAIQILLKAHPYLQFDTVRKIVYSPAVIKIEQELG